mgnify:FL=1
MMRQRGRGFLCQMGLAGLILCSALNRGYAAESKLEENLLNSNRVMTIADKAKKTEKWVKYNSQNKAVFSANVGAQKKANYEIITSDADGNSQQIWTHHPFEDRYPVWIGDKEIAYERAGKDSGKEIKAYYIINTETGKFKLIKQEEYNLLKEKSR